MSIYEYTDTRLICRQISPNTRRKDQCKNNASQTAKFHCKHVTTRPISSATPRKPFISDIESVGLNGWSYRIETRMTTRKRPFENDDDVAPMDEGGKPTTVVLALPNCYLYLIS